jgi:hypothetical protein
LFYTQDGRTPAYAASQNGHTKSLELLLSNNADVNAVSKVQRFNIFRNSEIEAMSWNMNTLIYL